MVRNNNNNNNSNNNNKSLFVSKKERKARSLSATIYEFAMRYYIALNKGFLCVKLSNKKWSSVCVFRALWLAKFCIYQTSESCFSCALIGYLAWDILHLYIPDQWIVFFARYDWLNFVYTKPANRVFHRNWNAVLRHISYAKFLETSIAS